MEYLGINLTREFQNICSRNYKTLLKEMKDPNKWRDISCSWIRRPNIVKKAILPKFTYGLNAIPIRILTGFLVEICKLILKFIWNCMSPE